MKKRWASAALLALAGTLWAQTESYVLNDNNARWEHRVLNPVITSTNPGVADLRNVLPVTTDHGFQQWWWIRTQNSTRELPVHWQLGFTQVSGNEAELVYEPEPGLEVKLRYRLVGSGPTGTTATLTAQATVTNNTGAPSGVALFHYHDMSVNGTLDSDVATVVSPNRITVVEGAHNVTVDANPTPNAAAVNLFATLRGLLTNTAIDNITNASGPFTGDEGGVFQWDFALAEGQSRTFTITITAVSPVPPPPPPVLALTDGDARFNGRETTTGRTAAAGSSDLIAQGNLDELVRTWWYYRTDAMTREFGVSKIAARTVVGPNEDRMTFNEDTEQLRFTFNYKLTDLGVDQTVLRIDYEVTNTAPVQRVVNVFNWTDMSVNGNSAGDTGALFGNGKIRVVDSGRTFYYYGVNPTRYQIGSNFPTIMINTVANDLDNSTTVANDVGAAYQWVHTLAAGASATGVVFLAINAEPQSALPGDTDASGCVDDADLTNIILDFGGAGGNTSGFAGTDINNDGIVDDADLTDLILNFGAGC